MPAEAATIVWDGSSSPDWADGSNWLGGLVPGATEFAYVDTLNTSPVVIGAGVNEAVSGFWFISSAASNVTISGGGMLTSGIGLVGLAAGETGVLVITGAGSQLNTTNTLTVGAIGTGTIDVLSGGALSDGSVALGADFGASGTVNVDGAGSIWSSTNNLVVVGSQGTGTASVTNGGAMTAAGHLAIGEDAGGSGTVSVSGVGSKAEIAFSVTAGHSGTGAFNILGGASVTSSFGLLGINAGSSGTATIGGTGSTWTTTSDFEVGHLGMGTLNLTNGGSLSIGSDLGIGIAASGVGSVVLSGAGSTLGVKETADIADAGYGEALLSNGATETSNTTRIGVSAAAQGHLQLSGTGTSWSTVNDLIVGHNGTADVSVLGGALLDTGGVATIGNAAGASGEVLVEDAGSVWHVTSALYVGNSGTGSITLSNGAALQLDTIVGIAIHDGSTGTVNIGATIGDAAAGAGTITAPNGMAFGLGAGTLVFNHTDTAYTFASQLSSVDATASIVAASGHTILTGNNSSFLGTTTVTGGTMSVNNQLGGTIEVSGGTLGGIGSLGVVNVNSGGVLAPGNSIGTTTVASTAFGSGATYAVEVDNTGASDLLHATGTVTINDGAVVAVTPENGTDDGSTYAVNTLYTIITADTGLSGTFDSVSDTFAFLRAELSYDPNNAFLTLTQDSLFSGAGLTPNQIAAGTGADGLTAGHAVFDGLIMLSSAEVPAALDALSGEAFATNASGQLIGSRLVRDAVLDRLGQSADAPAESGAARAYATPEVSMDSVGDHGDVWGQFYGSLDSFAGDTNAAMASGTAGGMVLGLDGLLGDWRVGAIVDAGFSALAVDARASSFSSADYGFGLYAGTAMDATRLDIGAAYTRHDISSTRSIALPGLTETLRGSYSAGTAQAFAQISHEVDLGSLAVTPYASLAYVAQMTDGFTETGGGAALSSAESLLAGTFATLGFDAKQQFVVGETTLATASVGMGWHHAYIDTPSATNAFAGGTPFTVTGAEAATDALALNAGLAFDFGGGLSMSADYSGQVAAESTSHEVKLSLAGSF